MAHVPPLPHSCNSWIVEEIATGKAVMETWCRSIAEKVNGNLFRVHTAYDWLVSLNAKPPASSESTS